MVIVDGIGGGDGYDGNTHTRARHTGSSRTTTTTARSLHTQNVSSIPNGKQTKNAFTNERIQGSATLKDKNTHTHTISHGYNC